MTNTEITAKIEKLYPEISSEILKGFEIYRSNIRPDPENIAEMRGWVLGWGFNDRREDCICAFPDDRDYMAGWEMLS